MPVEKRAGPAPPEIASPFELPNVCFLGSNVESGAGSAVVVHTGERTYFGALATSIGGERQLTSFDKGVNGFTWLMIRFIPVMVPTVFVINGLARGNWVEALLFAVAVAVGLTPEMLPMIVTVNLSKGALAMAREKVIVKRLHSIQNLGAMDVLCTDKAGTLTEGRIVLEQHVDVRGHESEPVLHYGYLNSFHHTGHKNLMDEAILDHEELEDRLKASEKYKKIDEVPFDFVRRRMSVIVEDTTGLNILICKGAVEEMLGLCAQAEVEGVARAMTPEDVAAGQGIVRGLNAQGFRVIALAYKEMPGAPDEPVYAVKDESALTLLGSRQVAVKVLTGDNDVITRYICEQVGMPVERILLGAEIEGMSDAALAGPLGSSCGKLRVRSAQFETGVRGVLIRTWPFARCAATCRHSPGSSLFPPEAGDGRGLFHPRCGLAFVEVVHRFEVHAPRVLAHPHRRHRGYGLECGATPEGKLDVADEAAAVEAPAVANAIPGHSPLHGALQGRQRPGRQGIDAFGDAALRLRQAADVGEHRLVPFLGLRGACPARHGDQQRRGDDWRGLAFAGFACLRLRLTDRAGHWFSSRLAARLLDDHRACHSQASNRNILWTHGSGAATAAPRNATTSQGEHHSDNEGQEARACDLWPSAPSLDRMVGASSAVAHDCARPRRPQGRCGTEAPTVQRSAAVVRWHAKHRGLRRRPNSHVTPTSRVACWREPGC